MARTRETRRLDNLTSKQEALLPLVRDEWIAHGLSTDPADRIGAEAGIRLAYQRVGLPEPARIVWTTSPLAGCLTITILTNEKFGASVGDNGRGSVQASDTGSVRAHRDGSA